MTGLGIAVAVEPLLWRALLYVPEGNFLTYGLGVSLRDMAKPDAALAHVPVR